MNNIIKSITCGIIASFLILPQAAMAGEEIIDNGGPCLANIAPVSPIIWGPVGKDNFVGYYKGLVMVKRTGEVTFQSRKDIRPVFLQELKKCDLANSGGKY